VVYLEVSTSIGMATFTIDLKMNSYIKSRFDISRISMFPTNEQNKIRTRDALRSLKLQYRLTWHGQNTHTNLSRDITTNVQMENSLLVSKNTKIKGNNHSYPTTIIKSCWTSNINEHVTEHMSATARTQKSSLVVLARGWDLDDVITSIIIVFPA